MADASPDDRSRADRPNRVPWPPLLYAGTLALAYGLQWLYPLRPLVRAPVSDLIGWPLFISGVCFGAAAILRFRALGTPVDPTGRPTRLAEGGIYRLSRNPMYLGAVMALLGLGLAADWTWLVLLSLVLPLFLYRLAIVREEARLAAHFGADYAAYCARVRRWL